MLWGGCGERKRERVGHVVVVPRALPTFSIIVIFIGIPSRASAEERGAGHKNTFVSL